MRRFAAKGMALYHCQICERDIKTLQSKTMVDVIAHHGYKRPYQEGWQTASCMGARELPYELSCDAIQPCIDHIKVYVKAMKRNLKEWMQFPPAEFTPPSHYIGHVRVAVKRPEGFDPEANLKLGSWSGGYTYEHAARARFYTREIEGSKKEITRLEKRILNWVAPKQ